MAIRFPTPPASLSELAAKPSAGRLPRPRLPFGGKPEAREVVPAFPVYTVGLDDLLAAGSAEASATRPPSWRFSRFDRDGNPEVVELTDDASGGAQATGDDRFSQQIREALAIAEDDDRAGAATYEARLLRIPALSAIALWLHARPEVDLFVPTGHVPGLEGRVYDDDAFMTAVRALATALLETFSDADDPDALG